MASSSHLPSRRWFSVGRSMDTDAATAGRAAVLGALAGAQAPANGDSRPDTALLIVFASGTYDLQTLVRAITEVSGTTPMIGCTTAGEIAADGPASDSVVVAALGGPGFTARTARETSAGADLRQAGHAVAAAATGDATSGANRVLLMLSDGMLRNQDEVVRGAYGAVGATIPLIGGSAGDDWRFGATYQFHDGEVLTDAVVAALLESDGPIGIGVRHGWTRVGEPMLVTASDAHRVYTFDDEPAVDVYLRMTDVPEAARRNGDAFGLFAATHPVGISRRSGEEVRVIGAADMSDGSVESWSHVPQGGMAWLMEGDADSVQQATVEACRDALDGLGGRSALGAIAFDCMGRRAVLDDDGLAREVATMSAGIGAPLAGFYTYGEIARLKGPYGYHNQTLAVLALG